MIDRRTMLKISLLVPAALAVACAPRAKGGRTAPVPAQAGGTGGKPDPLAEIRNFKLRADTEPAFVFRAGTK